jgi:membrane fusion protein (multidrug efflux system)
MFVIESAPFETVLTRAEAELAGSEARLVQARRNVARLKPLFEATAVSRKDYDDAMSAESIAEADVRTARTRVSEAKLNIGYTRVESPSSGIAGRALRSEGNLVSGPDVLLTTVTSVDPIYVLFGIPDSERLALNREVQAGRVTLPKNEQFQVSVRLSDGSIYGKTGKLNFADVRISGATATIEARAELPNGSGDMRPGQFVRVILSGAQRVNAILVPQRAVLEGPKGKFVYVVTDKNQADVRPVEVGDWAGDAWVITSGLKPGDRVIVDGVLKIGPGAPVQISEAAAPPAGAAKGAEGAKGAMGAKGAQGAKGSPPDESKADAKGAPNSAPSDASKGAPSEPSKGAPPATSK